MCARQHGSGVAVRSEKHGGPNGAMSLARAWRHAPPMTKLEAKRGGEVSGTLLSRGSPLADCRI